MGTAQYLSPEQAQGHAVTATSDIYSIGVMLYEMLAGRLPFEGDSAVAVALKHLSEQPPPISQWRPDVHPALEAVVMAALAKDPAQRWQSAEDLAAALEARARPDRGRRQRRPGHRGVRADPDARRRRHGRHAGRGRGSPCSRRSRARPRSAERRWPWFAIGLLDAGADRRPPVRDPERRAHHGEEGRAARDRQAARGGACAARARRLRGRRPSACGARSPSTRWSTRTRTRARRPTRARRSRSRCRAGPARCSCRRSQSLPQEQADRSELEDAGPQGDHRPASLGQGEEGLRDPHRAAGGRRRSPGAPACACS